MAMTKHDQAESNLKDYEKNYTVAAAGRVSSVAVSAMGGITYPDLMRARPNTGEIPLGTFRDIIVGQVLLLESGLGPPLYSGLESESERDSRERTPRYSTESKSKPSSHLGHSRASPMSHRGQTRGSFLPCCQKLHEEIEMLVVVPIDCNIHHSCG